MNSSKNNELKVSYGWYHVGMMTTNIFIGFVGVIALIFAFRITGILSIILFIGGVVGIIFFLWPALGILVVNITTSLNSDLTHPTVSQEIISQTQDPQILDIGCGSGRVSMKIAKRLNNSGKVFGIDIFNNAIRGNSLEKVQQNALLEGFDEITEFKYGSASKIPFEDNKFDLINMSYVFHEVPDKSKALSEIKRVLKPDGKFYLTEFHRNSLSAFLINGIYNLFFKNYHYWLDLLKENKFSKIEYQKRGPIGRFVTS